MHANLSFLLHKRINGKEDGDINSLLDLPTLLISFLDFSDLFLRIWNHQ
jgi:hypothetical protein